MNLIKIGILVLIIASTYSCNKKTAAAAVTPEAVETETAEAPRRTGQRGQRGPRDPEARKKRMEEMYAQLNLSAPQKIKVEEITTKYQEKRSAIFQNNEAGDRQAMRAEMQKMQEEQNAELKGVMTAEQFEKYLKIQEEQRQNRRGRGRPGN